ncbi:hypothetical protein [Streptomyces sp. DH20]|uniref:hypothetical protein n=1 Tax=Streptomyces sp. DH20 TaxID=2857009 RepID=UPI001E485B02|nr:hypothetical protein [Streptomyces sp. DH20]
MATIRVLQAIGGLDFSWAPGDLVDLPDDEAAKWADGHRAELVDQDPPPAPVNDDPKTPADTDPPADPDDPDDPGDQDDDPDGPVLFDPAEHNVKDVLAYLDGVGEQEALRVLQQEENAEEPRKGIVGQRGSILERAQANDEATERAAETSRGGGRGDTIETR